MSPATARNTGISASHGAAGNNASLLAPIQKSASRTPDNCAKRPALKLPRGSTREISAKRQNQCNPYLTMAEMSELMAKLNTYQGARQTVLGIRLLLLTGVRTGELRYAEPHQFDLKAAIWRIPPEEVKQLQRQVRTKNGKIPPYLVPLSRQAVAIIEELLAYRSLAQRYLLCHRSEPLVPISENILNGALKRMGYKDRLTGHGIRATLSTALNGLRYDKDLVEAQLSHADKDAVRDTYNHAKYVDERRKMMQEWRIGWMNGNNKSWYK